MEARIISRGVNTVADTSSSSSTPSGMMQTSGDLAKSVGRFGLAMSLLATRQAVSFVTPSKANGHASSLDDITKAAGSQLTGVARTAFAIGTNVSSGLVDAVFGLAGQDPKGESPTGDTSGLSIPLIDRAKRRVAGVQTVASGAVSRTVPQSELVQKLTQYHSDSTGGGVERVKTVTGLWQSEGLSTSIGKHLLPENTWKDPALPKNVLPIAHVGFGSGST